MVDGAGRQHFETRRLGEGPGTAPVTTHSQSFARNAVTSKLAQLTRAPHDSSFFLPLHRHGQPRQSISALSDSSPQGRARSSLTPCEREGIQSQVVTNGRFAAGPGALLATSYIVLTYGI